MIPTLLRVQAINLRRDRVGLLMRFLLPVAFFTVFALVFGGGGRSGVRPIDLLVVNGDGGRVASGITAALASEGGLRVRTTIRRAPGGADTTRIAVDRGRAEAMVRDGDASVAIVFSAGLDSALAGPDAAPATVELLFDPSNPIAADMAGGLLQKATMTALLGAAISSPIQVVTREVVGEKNDGDMIAFYAAGIAVMFLLFSSSAAAGTLLAEIESGTLDRLLTSGLGMGRLLVGKWLYVALAGVVQIVAMFVYAMIAFRLDLLGHLPGFLVMTVCTAATAAAFGVLLATLCRTREQLSGVSTLVVLMFSAFGGSMFPRFLMSEGMQKAGLFAFNAWALDGYVKVFWRDAPLSALLPQVGALLGFAAVFLLAARVLSRKWETA